MTTLTGQVGELRLTVEIIRKDTGVVEQHELVGYLDADKLKELQHGSHPLDSSSQRSD